MTARFLLDTDALSDLVNNPQGRVAAKILRHGDSAVATSIIVTAEARYGAAKRASRRLTTQLERVLAAIDILPFEAPADAEYAALRSRLEAAGTPIGNNDLFIAAQALALGLIVVTGNVREFRRVPGLKIENWLK